MTVLRDKLTKQLKMKAQTKREDSKAASDREFFEDVNNSIQEEEQEELSLEQQVENKIGC